MIYAHDVRGIRVEARKGLKGLCPVCGDPMVAKCGEMKVWHWAHVARQDCDPWWEHETEWHRGWKAAAPIENVEVPYGPHRADILAHDNTVIELQHSPISPEEIRAREEFYEQMVWLIDGGPFIDHIRVELNPEGPRFVWSHARPTWLAARKPRFIHGFTIGRFVNVYNRLSRKVELSWKPLAQSHDLLQIRSIKTRPRVEGIGRIITVERFVERFLRETERMTSDE